jgi:hypothetical protein
MFNILNAQSIHLMLEKFSNLTVLRIGNKNVDDTEFLKIIHKFCETKSTIFQCANFEFTNGKYYGRNAIQIVLIKMNHLFAPSVDKALSIIDNYCGVNNCELIITIKQGCYSQEKSELKLLSITELHLFKTNCRLLKSTSLIGFITWNPKLILFNGAML